MFSVREFMDAIAEALAERGTGSQDLLALQFEVKKAVISGCSSDANRIPQTIRRLRKFSGW
jgi:hypothetical protein